MLRGKKYNLCVFSESKEPGLSVSISADKISTVTMAIFVGYTSTVYSTRIMLYLDYSGHVSVVTYLLLVTRT